MIDTGSGNKVKAPAPIENPVITDNNPVAKDGPMNKGSFDIPTRDTQVMTKGPEMTPSKKSSLRFDGGITMQKAYPNKG